MPVSMSYSSISLPRAPRIVVLSPPVPWKRCSRPSRRRFNHGTGEWERSEEQGYYLIQTYWETESAFWDWTRSEAFREAHSNRPPAEMFAGSSVLEIHKVVLSTERADRAEG